MLLSLTQDAAIKKGMECLDLALNGIRDVYTTALMAYTFALSDQPCIKKAIKLLNELALEDRRFLLMLIERSLSFDEF